jgi:hypothetical protein
MYFCRWVHTKEIGDSGDPWRVASQRLNAVAGDRRQTESTMPGCRPPPDLFIQNWLRTFRTCSTTVCMYLSTATFLARRMSFASHQNLSLNIFQTSNGLHPRRSVLPTTFRFERGGGARHKITSHHYFPTSLRMRYHVLGSRPDRGAEKQLQLPVAKPVHCKTAKGRHHYVVFPFGPPPCCASLKGTLYPRRTLDETRTFDL